MLIPAKQTLVALQGGTFDVDIQFWQDTAETVPFPLTGQTVQFEVDGVATLTAGHGLTVQAAQGLVSVVLTAAQTSVDLGVYRYRVRLTDSSGVVVFPMSDVLEVVAP